MTICCVTSTICWWCLYASPPQFHSSPRTSFQMMVFFLCSTNLLLVYWLMFVVGNCFAFCSKIKVAKRRRSKKKNSVYLKSSTRSNIKSIQLLRIFFLLSFRLLILFFFFKLISSRGLQIHQLFKLLSLTHNYGAYFSFIFQRPRANLSRHCWLCACFCSCILMKNEICLNYE